MFPIKFDEIIQFPRAPALDKVLDSLDILRPLLWCFCLQWTPPTRQVRSRGRCTGWQLCKPWIFLRTCSVVRDSGALPMNRLISFYVLYCMPMVVSSGPCLTGAARSFRWMLSFKGVTSRKHLVWRSPRKEIDHRMGRNRVKDSLELLGMPHRVRLGSSPNHNTARAEEGSQPWC